jgi:hypothetical protein
MVPQGRPGRRDRVGRREQGQVAGLDRYLGTGTHRDAEIRGHQRGGVVDPVAAPGDRPA